MDTNHPNERAMWLYSLEKRLNNRIRILNKLFQNEYRAGATTEQLLEIVEEINQTNDELILLLHE